MIKFDCIGNIGKDAETKVINNKSYVAFSIGVKVNKDTTQWVNVLASNRESLMPLLRKGEKVYVTGQPTFKAYTKNSGEIAVDITLWAANIFLCGGRSEQQQQPIANNPNVNNLRNGLGAAPIDDDQLPF